MRLKAIALVTGVSITALSMLVGFGAGIGEQGIARAEESRDRDGDRDREQRGKRLSEIDRQINAHAEDMVERGRQIFRFDTYGSEAFFGDALQLHKAIAGAKNGGVGPGVSPKTALAVGLKVDVDALPNQLKAQLKAGKVNLDDPATTLALLKLNAVLGLTGSSTAAAGSRRWGPNAPCAIRGWTTRSRPASAGAWTAGPTAI
jgi:hypothetical protein